MKPSTLLLLAATACSWSSPLCAQAIPASATRAYVTAHEPALLREYVELLALPNLASDSGNIRRNADHLVAMLQRRGVDARLLQAPGVPPVVFGELRSPGARQTIVLYAHYDGQPLDPSQWASPPWQPTLRSAALERGGTVIPLPRDGEPMDGEARLYARSAGDDKVSIMAMLGALDVLKAQRRAPGVI